MRPAVVAISLLAALAVGFVLSSVVSFGGPHRSITIYMTSARSGNQGVVADCEAYVDADVLTVKRGHRIEWRIEDDSEVPCEGRDDSLVDVRLKTTVMGPSDGTATAPYVKVLRVTGVVWRRIRGQIAKTRPGENPEAPDGLHGYVIFYDDMQASPDPEFDVDGDCTNC
jgi:hypothetical protein